MEAPFDFACHRCGHCCSVSSGYVWVQEEEVARLAAAKGMTPRAFAAHFLRRIGDRLSLTERGGRCALLEVPNHCTVYEARPKHCRDFPYWPQILAGGDALRRAQEFCPGIQVYPDRAIREAAFEGLEAIYERVDAEASRLAPVCVVRGVCCEFERAGHELYASLLETDFAAWHAEQLAEPQIPGRCRYHVGGLCENRRGRPLGCRTYFCDPRHRQSLEDLHARFDKEIRALCARTGYPWGYGSFVEQLKRRAGRIRRDKE